MLCRRVALLCFFAVAAAAWPSAAAAGDIVFSSDRCADDADRQRRRSITNIPGPGGCVSALWRIDDRGGGLTRLTDGLEDGRNEPFESGDSSPSWSPEGQRIVFARHTARSGGSRLYVYQAGAERPVALAPPPFTTVWEDTQPSWSPLGERLVFASNRATRNEPDLFTVPASGGELKAITSGPDLDRDPTFSPDGRRVLFVRFPPPADWISSNPKDPTLYAVDTDGSNLTPLTTGGGALSLGSAPEFSPDGRFVVIAVLGAVYTMRADGSDLRLRFQGDQPVLGFAWVEPGPALVFAAPASRGFTERSQVLYRVELSDPDAKPRQLTPSGAFDTDPDWRLLPGVDLPVAVPDAVAPAVVLVDGLTGALLPSLPLPDTASGPATTAAARRVPLVSKALLRFLAIDRSGVRRVELAVSRGASRGRCRWLGGTRFGTARSCDRPTWRRIASDRAWRGRLSRLPSGTYRLRFRTSDRGA